MQKNAIPHDMCIDFKLKEAKRKETNVEDSTLKGATEQQPSLLKENNAATSTKLIKYINDQVHCGEETLEEQKESVNIWQLEQAATKLKGKTSTFQINATCRCCFCNQHNYNTEDCRGKLPYGEKEAKLITERKYFRCTRRIIMHEFAKQASHVISAGRHAMSVCQNTESKRLTMMATASDEQNEDERQRVLNMQRMKPQKMGTCVLLQTATTWTDTSQSTTEYFSTKQVKGRS